jgi:hypothetical protein
MVSPGALVDVRPGDLAFHDDGKRHMAVILRLKGDECGALFFTSSPDWAARSRRATSDELAMAGFVSTRPTYLAYVRRRRWDFLPTGQTFPVAWVEALSREFELEASHVVVSSS